MELGMTGLDFAMKLQAAGLPEMTESRVFRIATGRARITDKERNIIATQLGIGPYELFV